MRFHPVLKSAVSALALGAVAFVMVSKSFTGSASLPEDVMNGLSCVDRSVIGVLTLVRNEMETDIGQQLGWDRAFSNARTSATIAASHLEKMDTCLEELAAKEHFSVNKEILESAQLFSGSAVVALTLRGEAVVSAVNEGEGNPEYRRKMDELDQAWFVLDATGGDVAAWVGDQVARR